MAKVATNPLFQTHRPAPTALWMHLAFILTGLGTLLLGPILPLLTRQWHLSDAQGGLLFSAQFYGAFVGGLTVSRHLHRSMVVGISAAALGFGTFALAPGVILPACGLFVGGYGLGQLITSINILAGRRATEHRGSALAFLNFSWSFGAMLSPLLAAWLTPHFALRTLLALFAAAFLTLLAVLLLQLKGSAPELAAVETPTGIGLSPRLFAIFCTLLILYGGLETSLGGWLTTFSSAMAAAPSSSVNTPSFSSSPDSPPDAPPPPSFCSAWAKNPSSASPSPSPPPSPPPSPLAHAAALIAAFAVLLGFTMAPFVPATFSLLMAERPSARQAGIVIAVSAIGAAILPWLMGVVSTRTGSLQIALALPFAAALALLATSLVLPATQRSTSV